MNLFKRFNRPDTSVVITSFPNPTDGIDGDKGFNAVGWHSRKTLVELSKSAPVLVLAEKRNSKHVFRVGNKLTVQRAWKKGNIFSILSLFLTIMRLTKVKSVFAQFEFNVFGGIVPNLTLLFVLLLLRLSGKKVTFELHQVITDVGLLKKHVPITNPLLQLFFNFSLKAFYITLGLIASDIIVFEETLKERLSSYVAQKKIHVLCLSIEPKKPISKQLARKKLKLANDEFIVLVFGFINGYKGIDWIVRALSKKPIKKLRLLVAGGQNPYLKDQPHYQKLYNSIVGEIAKHPHMTHTGFVPDTMVDYYFNAADAVVLPYEVFMSASGPFSLAVSYKKPVLLSEKLLPYAESEDVKEALSVSGLTKKDIFFPLTKSALVERLETLQTKKQYKKRVQFSTLLAQLRASSVVVKRLHRILHTPSSIFSVPAAELKAAQ